MKPGSVDKITSHCLQPAIKSSQDSVAELARSLLQWIFESPQELV